MKWCKLYPQILCPFEDGKEVCANCIGPFGHVKTMEVVWNAQEATNVTPVCVL